MHTGQHKHKIKAHKHPCLKRDSKKILDCEAIGTAATPGLLYQPRVIVKMIVEKQMECRLAGKNRSSRGKKPAPTPLLSITKSHMPDPGLNPGRWGGKPGTNRLSYGAAKWDSKLRSRGWRGRKQFMP
jgi:hypothetical protein